MSRNSVRFSFYPSSLSHNLLLAVFHFNNMWSSERDSNDWLKTVALSHGSPILWMPVFNLIMRPASWCGFCCFQPLAMWTEIRRRVYKLMFRPLRGNYECSVCWVVPWRQTRGKKHTNNYCMTSVVTAIPHCTLFHINKMNIFERISPSYII